MFARVCALAAIASGATAAVVDLDATTYPAAMADASVVTCACSPRPFRRGAGASRSTPCAARPRPPSRQVLCAVVRPLQEARADVGRAERAGPHDVRRQEGRRRQGRLHGGGGHLCARGRARRARARPRRARMSDAQSARAPPDWPPAGTKNNVKGYPTLMLHKGDGAEGTKCACAAGARAARATVFFLTAPRPRRPAPHTTIVISQTTAPATSTRSRSSSRRRECFYLLCSSVEFWRVWRGWTGSPK
jgi:hypothetical protein